MPLLLLSQQEDDSWRQNNNNNEYEDGERKRTSRGTTGPAGDSDLLNGRREMSSDTNQMIHNNNNFLDENNQQATARSTSPRPPPGEANRGHEQGEEESARTLNSSARRTDRFAESPTRQTNRQAATSIASSTKPRQREQQPAHYRQAKFIKSKSSPSSLTTHKFGLRPTPSPPRLIIDHQTGDIVESYPEHPVYLRTYQPIETEEEEEPAPARGHDLNDSQLSLGDDHDRNSNQQHQPRPNQHHQNQNYHHHHHLHQEHHRTANQMQNVPPPPHAAAKVYFAPPATNSSPFGDQPAAPAGSTGPMTSSSRERARASFRRAINQLADTAERTDIAIVTEPDDYDRTMVGHEHVDGTGRAVASRPLGQMRVTATSASKGDALLAGQQQRRQQPMATSGTASKLYSQPSLRRTGMANQYEKKQQQQQQSSNGKKVNPEDPIDRPPAIEDFNLYSFCYCFRVLLVLLLSGSIIYLLIVDLHQDCSRFRPSSTYVSIITSSVNIISVTMFTLFWYCNGVTRTFYQNISASAFIVTMYTILVCINLALAILFFFTDTCHFQKVIATHSAMADWERFGQPLADGENGAALAANGYHYDRARRQRDEQVALEAVGSIELLLAGMQTARPHSKRQTGARSREEAALADDPNVIDDQLGGDPDQDQLQPTSPTTTTTTTTAASDSYLQDSSYQAVPPMSPIEAAWEYLKERARAFGRSFYRFLIHYDLKFIGALHALLAACFQYLAIKVAVVRSYFSSSANASF